MHQVSKGRDQQRKSTACCPSRRAFNLPGLAPRASSKREHLQTTGGRERIDKIFLKEQIPAQWRFGHFFGDNFLQVHPSLQKAGIADYVRGSSPPLTHLVILIKRTCLEGRIGWALQGATDRGTDMGHFYPGLLTLPELHGHDPGHSNPLLSAGGVGGKEGKGSSDQHTHAQRPPSLAHLLRRPEHLLLQGSSCPDESPRNWEVGMLLLSACTFYRRIKRSQCKSFEKLSQVSRPLGQHEKSAKRPASG